MERWVAAWGMAHASLSAMCYRGNRTFRLIVDSAISGEELRVRLSNRYGKESLLLERMYASLCTEEGKLVGISIPLSVKGKRRGCLKAGATVTTDPVKLSVESGFHIAVSVYVGKGKMLSGNAIDNALLLARRGDRVFDNFTYQLRIKDGIISLAQAIIGIYLPRPIPLFEGVELLNKQGASAIVCFGDSLTQQGRWLRPFEAEIRKNFPGRYSVINRGITGNCITRDTSKRMPLKGFFGEKALTRVAWDVNRVAGRSHVIVGLGINEVLQPGTLGASSGEKVSADTILDSLSMLGQKLKKQGQKVYLTDYIPIGLSGDATPEKIKLWAQLNARIRDVRHYDAVLCCSKAIADPVTPDLPVQEYVGADCAHPSIVGGGKMAEAIPMALFT